jgi:erythromycin esterase-like protein
MAAAGLLSACVGLFCCSATQPAPSPELNAVVERDAVAFTLPLIPDVILDRLAQNRVVVVGETHMIQEQGALMGELVRGLYDHGFRQLLLEWPHMADWLLADYVEDTGLEPTWTPPTTLVGGSVVTAVRDFNRSLAAGAEKFSVRAIDVNLIEYGGAASFRNILISLSEHLLDRGPINAFISSGYSTPNAQTAAISQLLTALQSDRLDLIAAWGVRWYDLISEMAEVESASINIRANRDSNYDQTTRDREGVIRNMADLRLDGFSHGTLVSVGNTHAQKSPLMGTSGVEWLGDYLVHRSSKVGGTVFVLAVTPARILSPSNEETYDVMDKSPANEVWRVMHQTWPSQVCFLPFDDALFSTTTAPMNFDGSLFWGIPKNHYDAFILLPVGHQVSALSR